MHIMRLLHALVEFCWLILRQKFACSKAICGSVILWITAIIRCFATLSATSLRNPLERIFVYESSSLMSISSGEVWFLYVFILISMFFIMIYRSLFISFTAFRSVEFFIIRVIVLFRLNLSHLYHCIFCRCGRYIYHCDRIVTSFHLSVCPYEL